MTESTVHGAKPSAAGEGQEHSEVGEVKVVKVVTPCPSPPPPWVHRTPALSVAPGWTPGLLWIPDHNAQGETGLRFPAQAIHPSLLRFQQLWMLRAKLRLGRSGHHPPITHEPFASNTTAARLPPLAVFCNVETLRYPTYANGGTLSLARTQWELVVGDAHKRRRDSSRIPNVTTVRERRQTSGRKGNRVSPHRQRGSRGKFLLRWLYL
ncbi:hypothetical protein AAFF_G00408210 [Aldrovandia affinis]|uniref:Uncharacterized protein n=1 Tax=Aldrovandia affinis TaxID=143900 RepID=A0AAD7WJW1_9TELE|nr:hypothetical protein AAFF_G00408210 [Aldrovandia affinis]